jgi:hypothetical protein
MMKTNTCLTYTLLLCITVSIVCVAPSNTNAAPLEFWSSGSSRTLKGTYAHIQWGTPELTHEIMVPVVTDDTSLTHVCIPVKASQSVFMNVYSLDGGNNLQVTFTTFATVDCTSTGSNAITNGPSQHMISRYELVTAKLEIIAAV